jgi:Double zinc ribbon
LQLSYYTLLINIGISFKKDGIFIMQCLECKTENSAASKFCEKCGKSLNALSCSACGAAYSKEDQFCNNCGTIIKNLTSKVVRPAKKETAPIPQREERYRLARQLALKKAQNVDDNDQNNAPKPSVYIGEKIY